MHEGCEFNQKRCEFKYHQKKCNKKFSKKKINFFEILFVRTDQKTSYSWIAENHKVWKPDFFPWKKSGTQDGSRKSAVFKNKVRTKMVLTHSLKEPEPWREPPNDGNDPKSWQNEESSKEGGSLGEPKDTAVSS
jgi:hypothetical protein